MEGPIKKVTASFIFSARRTFIDTLARPIIKAKANGAIVGYYFYDLKGKLNWKLSPRDRLYLSGYLGRDEFYANDKTTRDHGDYSMQNSAQGWGNCTAALRWNYVVNDRLFLNTHLTYTRATNSTWASRRGTATPPTARPGSTSSHSATCRTFRT